jgi:cell division protein FtsW
MQALLKRLQGDKVIWMVTFFLSIISLLAVYSAISTLAYKNNGNNFFFLLKHLFMIAIGFVVMYRVHKLPLRVFSRFSALLIFVAAGLLAWALLFGKNLNSADRWISIPFTGLTFQPSDFAKIVLIVYVSRLLYQKREVLDDFKKGVLPILIPIGVICGLILPANFSTAALLGFVCVLLMYMAGVPFKHIGKLMLIGVGFIGLIVIVGELGPKGLIGRYETWKHRLINYGDEDNSGNYQVDIAKYAIYEGGLVPKGPGTGSSRNFLPHPYSDMIYPFIIEEYGSLFGGIGLVLLYLILLFRSVRFAGKCPKPFGTLVAVGLSMMLVIQAIVNMGVAVSLLPTTGQPLPLVSMGGTSIVFTCLSIGILIAVSRTVFNAEEVEAENAARKAVLNQDTDPDQDLVTA